jgi:hypothetical protein
MWKQVAQASIRQNKVGVEKDLPAVRHRRTEITEAAMQCVRQCHSVFVFHGDEVVEPDQSERAEFLDSSY